MEIVAFVAAGSFVSSMVLLGAYQRSQRTWLGRAESYAFLVLYVSLAVLVVGLHGDFVAAAPLLVWTSTVIGAVGAVTCIAAESAALFYGVPFTRVAMIVTAAFGGVLLWMGGLSVAGLVSGALPSGLGWLGVGMVVVSALVIGVMARDRSLIRAERAPTPPEMAVGVVPFLGVAVWLVWLGVELAK
ncbi:MAG: hypothetical protein R6X29_07580 [Acidimicrobiia bacterium]|jgi:hypothetical protein